MNEFNAAMVKHRTWYELKKDSTTGMYYKASLTGYKAKHLIETAGVEDEGGSGWIKELEFTDERMVETTTAIWKTWSQVVRIGRALQPSPLEQATFGPLCRRLFRWESHTSFPSSPLK